MDTPELAVIAEKLMKYLPGNENVTVELKKVIAAILCYGW